MRKGFWKQPPLIWDVNPKQIRILNPFYMEIAADKLLSLPIQQPHKIKQVVRGCGRMGKPEGWGPGWEVAGTSRGLGRSGGPQTRGEYQWRGPRTPVYNERLVHRCLQPGRVRTLFFFAFKRTNGKFCLFLNVYFYLFLAVLGLCCCLGFALVVVSQGLLSRCGTQASHPAASLVPEPQALGRLGFSS